ncbi:MAG: putative gluconeogenesis factor [Candidatus Dojkabacteria bacterium]|nr:MAG: putative gluconeogenesis factor [Candidatus Dojkabacteria bacterium]
MKKRITVIGGGTGTMPVLNGLKNYPDLELTVIVNMTDDGGSNAVVRDEFGLLPLSDLRKSIIALAETNDKLLRDMFTYRFSKGQGLRGHTLGNLMMMALTDIYGSELEAVKKLSKLFNVKGNIIPVTRDNAILVAHYENGKKIKSEHLIDEPQDDDLKYSKIVKLSVEPRAKATKESIKAILYSDFIIIGPGDLYTSTLANLVIDGISEALQKTKAKIILITNLMTKLGQTQWMKASDLVNEVIKYSKTKPHYVLHNKSKINPQILERYKEENEYVFEDDLDETNYEVIRANFLNNKVTKKDKGDELKRSLVRHDPKKLGKILYGIFTYENFSKVFT